MAATEGFDGAKEHLTEEIIGWRAWKLGYIYEEEAYRPSGEELGTGIAQGTPLRQGQLDVTYKEPRLVSVGIEPINMIETPWPPGQKLKAVHWKANDHEAPHRNCMCGYWAFKRRDDLVARFGTKVGYVYGQTALWGHVIQGTIGYRSEYAYPSKIFISQKFRDLWNEILKEGRDVVAEVRREYQVEVEVFDRTNFF